MGWRFTPTGVGTMPVNEPRRLGSTVHPHGRGDNARGELVELPARGSPPRAWGQWLFRRITSLTHRFTPTGVGTMAVSAYNVAYSSVHPHGRGDNVQETIQPLLRYGSPPRAWGQFVRQQFRFGICRFTPTGVGTMMSMTPSPRIRSVHPHGRGDNSGDDWVGYTLTGSPPRAWGQLRQ